ncbi:MAG: amidohydrolase family protein [Anaerolineales bacterium]|nr:amidohydrolase family protein [Anaerolineales bacterium]
MTTLRLPGRVDAHVHSREPGYTHKEDFYSGTAAALAGGVTVVLDMPNTIPPTATPERLAEKARLAAAKAVCDVGLFVGATTTYADAYLPVATQACAVKIYVSDTFGSLRIDTLSLLHQLFRTWAETAQGTGYRTHDRAGGLGPITVHAEDLMLSACLALADLYHVPLHIAHVSRRSEIELIRKAKEHGINVTCEVTPHHLFLSTDDLGRLGNLGDMRPRLGTPDDVAALWENLAYVDIFATDHAPHTLQEKGVGAAEAPANPPPGVPGVETMLPLLLTAVHQGRLTLQDIVGRCINNPRRIYGLPEQPETWVDVDVDASFVLTNKQLLTRVGWSPFAGMNLVGRIQEVVLRGVRVYGDGQILAEPGSGRVLFVQPE